MQFTSRNETALIYLCNVYLPVFMILGYLYFYGVGRDIENIESILTNQASLEINPIEFIFNNFGYVSKILKIDAEYQIIIIQAIGLYVLLSGVRGYFPRAYVAIIIAIPNFYISSFSTIQMSYLIGFSLLALKATTPQTKFLYVIAGILFHWFGVIVGICILASKLSLNQIILGLVTVNILLSELFFNFLIYLSEIIIGGSRYTYNFVYSAMPEMFNTPLVTFILVMILIINSKVKWRHILNKKLIDHEKELKFVSLILLLVLIMSFFVSDFSLTLRIANIAVIPSLYLCSRCMTGYYQLFLNLCISLAIISNLLRSLLNG